MTAGVPARLAGFLPTMSEDILNFVAPNTVRLRGGLRAATGRGSGHGNCGASRSSAERAIPPPDDAFAVLSDRHPPWLGEWADAVLSLGSAGEHNFNMSTIGGSSAASSERGCAIAPARLATSTA